MKTELRNIWRPALATLLLEVADLFAAARTGMFPHGFNLVSKVSLVIYLPFVLGFLLAGAVGAYMSRRTGNHLRTQLKLLLLPVIVLLGMFFILSPLSFPLLVEAAPRNVGYLLGCLLRWVLIPTVALMGGALPFLASSSKTGQAASHKLPSLG